MEVVRLMYEGVGQYLFYLGADDHFGGDDFNQKSFVQYHDEAANRGAVILKFGDQVGAITHRDPRYSARTVKDSLKKDYFVNAVLDELVELWKPYVDHVGGFGMGNHEVSFLKFYGVNLIMMLIARLNALRSKKLRPIAYLDYCGFIWMTFKSSATNGSYSGYKAAYHHGFGSNAPVTEGIIAAKRFLNNVDDVDLLIVAHLHKNWSIRTERFRLNRQGNVVCRPVRLVQVGTHQQTYKEPGDFNMSWAETKGFPPAPYGGVFLTLTAADRKEITARVEH